MANLETLREFFDKKLFRIPDYQRGYSWEEEQLDDLWNDLENIRMDSPSSCHFTGVITYENISESGISLLEQEGIIFDQSKKNAIIDGVYYSSFYIVDGQQRITTLLILIYELIKSLDQSNPDVLSAKVNYIRKDHFYRFGYEKDIPSYQCLRNQIFEDDTVKFEEPETLYTHNLSFAKHYFEEKVRILSESDRLSLLGKIETRLLFYLFEIDSSKLNMSMVFETLNNRGIVLSKLELLKNRLIYLVTKRYDNDTKKQKELRDSIVKAWLHIYEWLGKNKERFLDDDTFLRAFYVFYFTHKEKAVEKELTDFYTGLFKDNFSVQDYEKNEILRDDDLKCFLERIERSAKIWFFINNPLTDVYDDDFNRFTKEMKHNLFLINQNKSGEYVKILLLAAIVRFFQRSEKNENELASVIENVEHHNFCVYYLNGNKTNTNRAEILRLANPYYKGDYSHGEIVIQLNRMVNNIVKIQEICKNIKERAKGKEQKFFFSWEGCRYFLWEWEEHLRGDRDKLIDYNAEINMIFAEDSRNQDFPLVSRHRDKQSIDFLKYSLGNLFLSKNHRREARFSSQRTLYKEKPASYSEMDICKYEEWSDKNIYERGKKMLQFMIDRWGVECLRDKEDEMKKLLLGTIKLDSK